VSTEADPDEPDDVEEEIVPGKGDVDEAMRLLAWSRKTGFEVKSLRIGKVIVEGISDRKPRFGVSTGPSAPRDAFEDLDPSYYRSDH
jgi:hypothetical protein